MKQLLIIIFLFYFSTTISYGQLRFGLRGGVNTLQVDKNSKISPVSQLSSQIVNMAIEETNAGIAAGVFLQAKVWKILIQPEVLFSETRISYNVTSLDPAGVQNVVNEIKSEKSQYIDIPLLLGVKFGPLRLMVGPEAHIFLSSTSELLEFDNYEEKFKSATYGWVADVGLDINKFLFDVRYEGNFSAIGDQFNIDGQDYKLDSTPGRWVFTVGLYF